MFSKCVEFITPGTGRCQQNELRWGLRTLKYAKAFTPRTSNYCLSTRRFPKCGRCSGAIYSQYNIENLLSLSREGDIVGPFVVNDVSGGCEDMWRLLGQLQLPYIAMHTRGTPKNMQNLTDYDNVTEAVREFFEGIAAEADRHGVEDWILDPGFGFAKTVEQNWQLLREMAVLQEFGKEILVGLSRKSFLFRPLGITPADALPATQVADFIALQNGADILRVHDVAEAVRTVKLYRLFNQASA